MPSAQAVPYPVLAFDEYLERERYAADRHEFNNGLVYMMAGGSVDHSRIALATYTALTAKLARRKCEVLGSDLRVITPDNQAAYYPDLSVHCDQKLDGKEHGSRRPILIVEVTSPSTRRFDLTTKRKEYFRIPTLCHYLVLDSESVHAQLYSREPGATWPKDPIKLTDLKASLALPALNLTLKLRDLYRGTEFV